MYFECEQPFVGREALRDDTKNGCKGDYLKCKGFWIPNVIETYPCGAKYVKEIFYRKLHYREMGVKVLKVTMT